MKLYSVETGLFRLDGGAMFGVVPKTIWQKTNPANENNLILLNMRALLIEYSNRLVLVDNGLGHKYNDKFKQIYDINHDKNTLDTSLHKLGFSRADVTDVILTHLHFDHCGGSTEWNGGKNRYEVAFKNAKFYVQKSHWEWANKPNAREKSSFFAENLQPIAQSGQLECIEGNLTLFENLELRVMNGHTVGMQLPLITYKNKKILYAADLIPTHGHIPLPYVMGYDMFPLTTLQEKEPILQQAVRENWILFYEHDPCIECSTVTTNEKGGFVCGEKFSLQDIV
ncbi:MAG: MBL fold metallo-hydrolase [Bacteroidia bacterium]|nr:MBL fold metallo-hydrolase [Bacteroidia bacterium]MDW8348210.1 MBL fold metallo-hydrolase [Bacteroidia bacterium]